MTSIVLLKNKKSGKIYAYVNEKVYDTEKGKDVYKRRCVGHLDPFTGEIMPNRDKRERPPLRLSDETGFGIMESIADEIGLKESLQASFPESWQYILRTITSCLFDGRIQSIDDVPDAPDVMSRIVNSMRPDSIRSFFRIWARINSGEGYSKMYLSSYDVYDSRNYSAIVGENELMRPMLTDSEVIFANSTRLPIFFRRNNVPHESDGLDDDSELGEWASDKEILHVFGKSEGDQVNVERIRSMLVPYVIHIREGTDLFDSLVDRYGIGLPDSTDENGSRVHRTIMRNVDGRREYVHIFFDPMKAEMDDATFLSQIERYRMEIINGNRVRDHMSFYRRYFLIGPDSVELNSEAIMKKTSNSGFDIVLSNREKNAENVSGLLAVRKVSENNFDDIFNDEDRIRLRLYLERNIKYRYFIQFLVLVLKTAVYNRTRDSGMSVRDVLTAVKEIRDIKDPWKKNKGNVQLTDVQSKVLDLLRR